MVGAGDAVLQFGVELRNRFAGSVFEQSGTESVNNRAQAAADHAQPETHGVAHMFDIAFIDGMKVILAIVEHGAFLYIHDNDPRNFFGIPRVGAGVSTILTEKEMTMKTKYALLAASVLSIGVLASGAALADRAPTGAELEKIQTALKGMGYTAWESIEMDSDQTVWEIDNAKLADGTVHDLKLATDSLAVVEKDPE